MLHAAGRYAELAALYKYHGKHDKVRHRHCKHASLNAAIVAHVPVLQFVYVRTCACTPRPLPLLCFEVCDCIYVYVLCFTFAHVPQLVAR